MADIERVIETRELEREALELRRSGHTYRQIAAVMNCSSSAAHERVTRAIAAHLPKETVEAARAVELDRLDELVTAAREIVLNSDEDEVRLKAIDRLVKVAERRARLLGLDAPTNARLEVAGAVTAEDLERIIGQSPDDADARG